MYKKEIVFLIWQDKPGGIEVLLPQIINSFIKEYKFMAFVFRPLGKNKESVFKNIKIKTYYGSNYNLILYIKFIFFLLKRKNNIFHGFNVGPKILLIIKLLKIKNFIYSIHGTIYWKKSYQKILLKIVWNLALSNNFVFIANSNYAKAVFKKEISDKTDLKIIYNPFNTKRFSYKVKNIKSSKELKIFYVGRLVDGKNLFKWIDISKFILVNYPNTKFYIYGNGYLYDQLNNYISRNHLSEKIVLKGFKKDIEKAYYENDLLLFLSQYESFGNIAVESILCGTPVIVSNIPSMEEIFKNYPEFLVSLNKNLSDEIIKKINQYEYLVELAKKASNEFKEKFALENHIFAIREIYENFD